jgi:lactate dehydrogenase-like 2-hydroxyacid dehydrogenase
MKKYKKVAILDSVMLYPEHRIRLNEIADEVVEYNTCKDEQEVLERVKGADCIISCWVDVTNKVIDENPQLKTIAFWTHAYEHRIDIDYALKRGIHVPCIPDYGTDSVAELVFIGLLELFGTIKKVKSQNFSESVFSAIGKDVRKYDKNIRDNLRGSWMHEYVKSGKVRIDAPSGFAEETLKGLTVGLLLNEADGNLVDIITKGFKMNAIHSAHDIKFDLGVSFRPIDSFLKESHIIVYDSTILNNEMVKIIKQGDYLSTIDISKIGLDREILRGKKLGIIGLGRIGERTAQIARDGFDMDVSYFSRTKKPGVESRFGIKSKSLEEVLTQSDIISFHLPHVGAERFVTNKMLDLIPKGTIIINVSVGNIFEDQDYFLSRFNENDLIGYIDVYDTLPPREILKNQKDRLLSTYRLGWRTKSTIGLKSHKLITKIKEGLK